MTLRALASSVSVACLVALFAACSAGDDGDGDGNGNGNGKGGGKSPGTVVPLPNPGGVNPGGGVNGECGRTLPVIFRDFRHFGEAGGHPDFQASARGVKEDNGKPYEGWNEIGCGLVQPTLTADRKPTAVTAQQGGSNGGLVGTHRRLIDENSAGCYVDKKNENPDKSVDCNVLSCVPWSQDGWDGWFFKPGETNTQHWGKYAIQSAETFAQWFNTVDGVNIEIAGELPLVYDEATGISVFDSNRFFPIDNEGYGITPGLVDEDGVPRNFHFTTEIHLKFKYVKGQRFSFRGDDDLWIFVNDKLALDLGGQHQALRGEINFDILGLVEGQDYNMDIFHAERQSPGSNFRIETNISCFEPVVVTR